MFEWTTENQALWARLEAFDLNESGASLSFEARLSRDNGWSLDFAARVIDEYKRFVFLACAANHPVTPSEEVDQVWHLHLCYTRSYWDDLCGEVLGMPLHHGPTRGGREEGAKFEDWYARTLGAYREAFDEEPPGDIWPSASIRFGEAAHFRRVNVKRNWVIAKPQVRNWKLAPASIAILILAGCGTASTKGNGGWNVLNWSSGEFLALFWSLCALLIPLALWKRKSQLLPDDSNFPTQTLDAYALARLASAGSLPVDVALAALHFNGFLEISERGGIRRLHSGAPTHPFEREVWTRIGTSNRLSLVRSMLFDAPQIFDSALENHGLMTSAAARLSAVIWPVATGLGLIGLGATKMLGDGRFDWMPTVSMGAILVGVLCFTFDESARLTKRGKRWLQQLRVDERARSITSQPQTSAQLARRVALLGYEKLDAFGLVDVRRALMPSPNPASANSNSGSGGSSGDSGSSSGNCDSSSSDGGSSGCGGGCGGGGD